MLAEKVKEFFDQVVVKYNCGDIRALLDAKLDEAGPLLTCVVNGIDFLGGMILGFAARSRPRSVHFMVQYLKLPNEVATLVYALVRCGVAHEGTTKLAIKFFVFPDRLDRGRFLYKSNDNAVWLNVTELAHLYLEAIGEIAKDVGVHLSHVPNVTPNDEAAFAGALGHIKTDITVFYGLVAKSRDASERDRFGRGEIEYMSSASPFLAEWLAHFTAGKNQ